MGGCLAGICYFNNLSVTKETPGKEERSVDCFCGFGEGIDRVPWELVWCFPVSFLMLMLILHE